MAESPDNAVCVQCERSRPLIDAALRYGRAINTLRDSAAHGRGVAAMAHKAAVAEYDAAEGDLRREIDRFKGK